MNDTTAVRQADGRFIAGHSVGRPPGARSKLGEAFIADFYESWKESGASVLRRLIEEDPAAYAKIAALLVSKIDDHAAKEGGVTVVNVITGVHG